MSSPDQIQLNSITPPDNCHNILPKSCTATTTQTEAANAFYLAPEFRNDIETKQTAITVAASDKNSNRSVVLSSDLQQCNANQSTDVNVLGETADNDDDNSAIVLPRKKPKIKYFNRNMIIYYGRECLCILIFIFTTYATYQNM